MSADWTPRRKQLWGMGVKESPLPLGAATNIAGAGLSDREVKLLENIVDRFYCRGRKLHGAFTDTDTDRDGTVSVDDIIAAVERLGLAVDRNEISAIAYRYSADGSFDYKTFVKMLNKETPDGYVASAAPVPLPVTPTRTEYTSTEGSGRVQEPPSSLEDARALFFADERISAMALVSGLQHLKTDLSGSQKVKLMHVLDTNPDRTFSYPEFLAFVSGTGAEELPAAGYASPGRMEHHAPLPLGNSLQRVGSAVGLPYGVRVSDKMRLDSAVREFATRVQLGPSDALKRLVKLWDRTQKGFSSYADFKRGVEALGVDFSERAADRLLSKIDSQGSGCITADLLEAYFAAPEDLNDDARSVMSMTSTRSRPATAASHGNPITGEGDSPMLTLTGGGRKYMPRDRGLNPITHQ